MHYLFKNVLQYSQDLEDEVLHYHVLCLNESSKEDGLKKDYHKLDFQSYPDKNKHPQASDDFCMIHNA